MSEDEIVPGNITGLVCEYTVNLQKIIKEVDKLKDKFAQLKGNENPISPEVRLLHQKRQEIVTYVQRLAPAIRKLIQSSSQWVQHGRVTDTSRLELEIRLADLEATSQRLDFSISMGFQ